jgi:UDP-glucose 4-epimerase
MRKRVLVTGGAGYIGAHIILELLKKQYAVTVFDSLLNSFEEVLDRVRVLAESRLDFIQGDIRDHKTLLRCMYDFKPEVVIHLAGIKSVANSLMQPLEYYDVNVGGSINVLQGMSEVGCKNIIFSSSATVYNSCANAPYTETDLVDPISPYGRTKLVVENLLEDWTSANKGSKAVCLRYFNPVGADASGSIGEITREIPANLMPLILLVASKQRHNLSIFGDDYPTKDGTCERDYIHVSDLARAHALTIEKLDLIDQFQILNIGTGQSTSVKELIQVFEETNKVKVNIKISERRGGDVPISYADPSLANKLLNFQCKKTLSDMCADAWNWHLKNGKHNAN